MAELDPRAESLAKLFRLFPGGLQDGQRFDYLAAVQRHGITAAVLEKAVEHFEDTWEKNLCPKIAALLGICREAKAADEKQSRTTLMWMSQDDFTDLAIRRLENRTGIEPDEVSIARESRAMREDGCRVTGVDAA